jgi:hypothetical protein
MGTKPLDKTASFTALFVTIEILVTAERKTAGGHVSHLQKESTSEDFSDVKILPACLTGAYDGVPYGRECTLEYCIKYWT